jgi:hypothetical protein
VNPPQDYQVFIPKRYAIKWFIMPHDLFPDSPISDLEERARDEVVKRMLATPPQPREKKEKKAKGA